jgi:putative membrane-bound metal-dependent hydrolase
MAAGIAICRPQTMPMLIAGAGLAAFGGTICDIDVETSDAHEQVDRMLVVAVIMVAAVVVMDFIFRVGIYRQLMANSNIARVIIGSLAFLMICAFGKEQPHRSFMHSFLALAMLSICVYIIFPDMTPYFMVGFMSHMFIDVFNRKREKFFWPVGKGFCLHWCSANGIVNKILFYVSTMAVVLFVLTSRPVFHMADALLGFLHR